MQPIYMGVDIAGAENTWFAALAPSSAGIEVIGRPGKMTLEGIVQYCQQRDVLAVAIDAQLTTSISEDKGFRPSDSQLQATLPSEFRGWVLSLNSLMAVPVRGMMLAEHLSPIVGTILETHPRASMYLGLETIEAIQDALQNYKKGPDASQAVQTLWQAWSQRFQITTDKSPSEDGALDALVCATTAYLYHHSPETLLHLSRDCKDLRGRGPFYVLDPKHFSMKEMRQNVGSSNDIAKQPPGEAGEVIQVNAPGIPGSNLEIVLRLPGDTSTDAPPPEGKKKPKGE
jgi:predicted nuclease with RNAse H fold